MPDGLRSELHLLARGRDPISVFAKPSVTLQPMVVHYRDGIDGELKHKSFIMTTDEMSHKAFSVCIHGANTTSNKEANSRR